MSITIINPDKFRKPTGSLSVKIIDASTKVVKKEKKLGSNLVVNNAKFIMAHLINQSTSAVSPFVNVKGWDPRDTAPGGFVITTQNPTAANLKLTYMAFGIDTTATDVTQPGLYSPIPKTGLTSATVANYLYNSAIYEFEANGSSIEDAYAKIIVTMSDTEGNGSGTVAYTEAGLFTSAYETHNTQLCPIMFARKTFSVLTKDSDLILQFTWTIQF